MSDPCAGIESTGRVTLTRVLLFRLTDENLLSVKFFTAFTSFGFRLSSRQTACKSACKTTPLSFFPTSHVVSEAIAKRRVVDLAVSGENQKCLWHVFTNFQKATSGLHTPPKCSSVAIPFVPSSSSQIAPCSFAFFTVTSTKVPTWCETNFFLCPTMTKVPTQPSITDIHSKVPTTRARKRTG